MEPHHARPVSSKVLRLRSELAVWSGEQQIRINERVERCNIRAKLRDAQACFERDDFNICIADHHCGHLSYVRVVHGSVLGKSQGNEPLTSF